MAKYRSRRRRNPFAGGSINMLATKVAGGLAGGIAAATIPNIVSPSLSVGWGGVGLAGVIAFGGSYATRGMSQNLSEGWLIGGLLQTAGRIAQLLVGKNLVSFSLKGYGPMNFPVPTPAYNLRSGPGVTPMTPASASASKPVRVMAPAGTMGRYANSRWGSSRFAA